MPKTYVVKIGATTMPKNRMCNLGKNLKICCISKPHYNFFENEKILEDVRKENPYATISELFADE